MYRSIVRYLKILIPVAAAALLCGLFVPVLLTYTHPLKNDIYDLSVSSVKERTQQVESKEDANGWTAFLMEGEEKTSLFYDGIEGFTGIERPGQTFYYSRVMDQEVDDPTLRIGVVNRNVSVFLDGQLLYTDCPDEDNRIGYLTLPMKEWDEESPLVVALPSHYLGKTLTIAQSTGPSEKQNMDMTAYPCSVVLYCGYASESALIADAASNSLPAMAFFLFGFFSLLLMVFQTFSGKLDWGMFFPAACFFLLRVSQVADAPYYHKYFPWSREGTGIDLNNLGYLLSSTSILLFLCTRMDRPFRLPLGLSLLVQVIAVLAHVWYQYRHPELPGFLKYHLLFFSNFYTLLLFLAVTVLAFLNWKRKNRFYSVFCITAGITAGGFAAFLAAGALLGSDYPGGLFSRLSQVDYSNTVLPLRGFRILFLICAFVSVLFEFIWYQKQTSAERTAILLKEKMAQDSSIYIKQQVKQTAILRHDINRHLLALQELLADGQSKRASDYAAAVSEQLATLQPILSTGNYMIDILFNSRLLSAADTGIKVSVERAEAPASLPLGDTDLTSLLLNALDNAIQAAAESSEKPPYLRLDLHIKGRFFYVSLENSKSNEPSAGKINKKRTVELHGYGILIMKNIVEKYGGILETKELPGKFRTAFAIPLESQSGQSET